ncbi:right-handed parallel beta-helix repeat-containing protein [Verrucomicrobiales bacterium BCK34]|nr:right-handed parallel beta-helix repeat-containing protein [Verrucomicrobiales bacterium BCK34]
MTLFGIKALCAGGFRAAIVGFVLLLSLSARSAEINVSDAAGLQSAVANAQPGTTILLAPGDYGSGFHFKNINGTSAQPIIIEGVSRDAPPLFSGGKEAIHLSDCNHLVLRNLQVSGCSANGINCDDGGSFETPSQGIVFDTILVTDIGPEGNFDGLKLSGLKNFRVTGCLFHGWGGAAVDMVGCREGEISNSHFLGKEGFSQTTGIQAKGGTEKVRITGNFFHDAGARGINLGGSTGNQFFRPELRNFEAKDLEVLGNHFVGSDAAIAYVTSVGCVVRHNTIVHPRKWIFRILQEKPLDQFQSCRDGVFEENLIVYDKRVTTFVNVGGGTKPGTFTIRGNAWFCSDGPRRPSLPVEEIDGIYQIDPLLEKADSHAMKMLSKDPRLKSVGAHAHKSEHGGVKN